MVSIDHKVLLAVGQTNEKFLSLEREREREREGERREKIRKGKRIGGKRELAEISRPPLLPMANLWRFVYQRLCLATTKQLDS